MAIVPEYLKKIFPHLFCSGIVMLYDLVMLSYFVHRVVILKDSSNQDAFQNAIN